MMSGIHTALSRKGANLERLARQVIRNPELIAELLDGLQARQASIKYGCEKLLRQVSERKPELVYPHYDIFVKLLDSDNSFLKWGAILTLANLAAADTEGRIEKLFTKYFAPVTGPVMVTAGNIVGAAAKIAYAKPALTARIVRQLLKVESATYEHKGAVSPECRRIVCGQAITTFDAIFDQIRNKKPVLQFAERQLESTRPSVRKIAARFMKQHSPDPDATGKPAQRHAARTSKTPPRPRRVAGRASVKRSTAQ